MFRSRISLAIATATLALTGCTKTEAPASEAPASVPPTAGQTTDQTRATGPETAASSEAVAAGPKRFRVATFNISFHRDRHGQLAQDLATGSDPKAHKIAHAIQLIRPHLLLLNEFDYDREQNGVNSFLNDYLGVAHGDEDPIEYPFVYSREVNTGVPSGVDLDGNGRSDGWNDCFGFGKHPGNYGMVVLSKYPIDEARCRTFQKLKWKDMPDANLPTKPNSAVSFYSDEALDVFRLSSKSHWDVVINVFGKPLHFLVSHPTPPVFDGPEDRNGKRNHDEIRLLADYISPDRSGYITDDSGQQGGLPADSLFVIAGDLNADPHDGDSHNQAVRQLVEHPLIQATPVPSSRGAAEAGLEGANARHKGDSSHDTGDFNDRQTGNLRVDYVLPSKGMRVRDNGVFWPAKSDPHHSLLDASDHRMVWVDLELIP